MGWATKARSTHWKRNSELVKKASPALRKNNIHPTWKQWDLPKSKLSTLNVLILMKSNSSGRVWESPEISQVLVKGWISCDDSEVHTLLWASAIPWMITIADNLKSVFVKRNKADSKLQRGCSLNASCSMWAKSTCELNHKINYRKVC